MIELPFKISLPKLRVSPESCLGIDIGTAMIKIVSLVKSGARIKLENYGETPALTLYEKPFRTFEKNTLFLSTPEIAKAIKAILTEAKIQGKKTVFSIPDFSTFFTNFELPPMMKEEIPQAVRFEAPQHIPLPLSEVNIDWQVIGGEAMNKKGTKLKILLVAVPNEIINQYQGIAKLSNLELQGLEAEAFSLTRAVIKGEDSKKVISIIDIGAQSTTCSIIDKGTLKISHSFDIAGNELTQILAKGLNIDYKKAEDLKRKHGLQFFKEGTETETPVPQGEINSNKIAETWGPTMDSIVIEVERIFQNFRQAENKKIQKIILSGGTALMPGLKEKFSSSLRKEVEITNPFADIFYPPLLEDALKEMGPAYAIAIGAALKELEKK